MNNNAILSILKDCSAILDGHFLLSSGKHSSAYVQCAKLLRYPWEAEKVMGELAKKLESVDVDLLVGPAMGGIIAAYELGRLMKKEAIFTERQDGEMTLRRGFEIKEGAKCLIVEDVITTAKSSFETKEVIERAGGKVIALACIIDRTREKVSLPIYSAIKLDIPVFGKDSCPLCKSNTPIDKPGSRVQKVD